MNNYRQSLIFFIGMLLLSNSAFADEAEVYNREPVIKQCLKDRICTCQDMGGDVYNEGLKTRCVFDKHSVESVYSYFIRFHTPELSGLLLKEIPTQDRQLTKKDKNESSDTEINYFVFKNTKKLKIDVDFIYAGYSYTFTPKGNDTILELVYFSYN